MVTTSGSTPDQDDEPPENEAEEVSDKHHAAQVRDGPLNRDGDMDGSGDDWDSELGLEERQLEGWDVQQDHRESPT